MDIHCALQGGTAVDFSPLAVCKALTSDTVKASQHIEAFQSFQHQLPCALQKVLSSAMESYYLDLVGN